jgi:hypothetical protein
MEGPEAPLVSPAEEASPDPSGWLELEPGAGVEDPAGGFLGPQPASRDRDSAAVRSRERVRFIKIFLSDWNVGVAALGDPLAMVGFL